MKYYLIMNKEDDYGGNNKVVIYAKEKDIKNKVYHYVEIPKEHYDVLKIYLGDFDEYYERENLEEYFG